MSQQVDRRSHLVENLAFCAGVDVSMADFGLAAAVGVNASSTPGVGEAGVDKLLHANWVSTSKTTAILSLRMMISFVKHTQARLPAISEYKPSMAVIYTEHGRLPGSQRP